MDNILAAAIYEDVRAIKTSNWRDYVEALEQVFAKNGYRRLPEGDCPLLTDTEMGDALDLEREMEYHCSNGDILRTVDVLDVVQAQRDADMKWMRGEK